MYNNNVLFPFYFLHHLGQTYFGTVPFIYTIICMLIRKCNWHFLDTFLLITKRNFSIVYNTREEKSILKKLLFIRGPVHRCKQILPDKHSTFDHARLSPSEPVQQYRAYRHFKNTCFLFSYCVHV